MKICLIIPTLNEEKNIIKLFNNIKKTKIKLNILFVDDNSSDQTQKLIIFLKNKYNYIDYLFRKKKIGNGSANKNGIKLCYKKKYDLIITMDADGTHDPKYLKKMITKATTYDYIITSRYKRKNLLVDWPLFRKMLTYARHFLVKIFLGMSYDASGAYRCFFTKKIKLKDIMAAKNNDYAFFWELTYIIKNKNYSIHEIPVQLVYRKLGKSKMKIRHIFFSLLYLYKIFNSKN